MENEDLKIAFITDIFPAVSETFIIDQIAGLIDRGIKVEIFSFRKGNKENITDKFLKYEMEGLVSYLEMPGSKLKRLLLAIPNFLKILILNPLILFRVLNFKKYGRGALSLKLVFWVAPFVGKKFDLIHCHFGRTANKYLIIRDILGHRQKFITTFYGYDVSMIPKLKGPHVYDRLKKECSLFFVMSENMKERVIALGFDEEKVLVHPVGINLDEYEFRERRSAAGETVNIVSVGRFVEKKGFDDLLRSLAIVKKRSRRPFKCFIIGDGPLKWELINLRKDLRLEDVVDFKGYMKIQDIIKFFMNMHFFVQPSKTAKSGDME